MSHVYESAATRIIGWLHHAERDLVGRAVTTFNGESGTVKHLKLDDLHGLCFTVDELPLPGRSGARRWFPVSTIKIVGNRV